MITLTPNCRWPVQVILVGLATALGACGPLESQQPQPFLTAPMTAQDLRGLFLAPTPRDWEVYSSLNATLPALVASAPRALAVVRSLLVEQRDGSLLIRGGAIHVLEYVQAPAAVTLLLEILANPGGVADSLDALYVLSDRSDPRIAPLWRTILASGRGGSIAEYAVHGLGFSGDVSDLPLLEQLTRSTLTRFVPQMAQAAIQHIRDPASRRAALAERFANPESVAEQYVPVEPMARAMARDLCDERGGPRYDFGIVRDWCGWALRAGYAPAR